MRECAERRGFTIAGEYVERGISGSRDSRPQLDRLMVDCRRRKLDVVLVYRYDRFARSMRHLVNALDEFRSLGIDFVSLHEGVDTSTANGRLIFGSFASIAEFERELIRDRVRSGLARARAQGKRIGRPLASLDLRRLTKLRTQGWGWNRIARDLGVGPATVLRAAGRAGLRYEGQTGSRL